MEKKYHYHICICILSYVDHDSEGHACYINCLSSFHVPVHLVFHRFQFSLTLSSTAFVNMGWLKIFSAILKLKINFEFLNDTSLPRYIRVEHYRYIFTKIGSKDARLGRWWKRSHVGNYLPPISLDSVKAFMKNMDYEYPRIRRRKKHWFWFK